MSTELAEVRREPADGLAAVLFDMDGLLVDSEPLWYEVEESVMARLGGPWGPEHQAALVGGSMDRTVGYMLAVAEVDVPPAVVESWLVEGMVAALRHGVPAQSGALELLDALAGAGVPAALVSSSYRVLVDAVLEQVGPSRFAVSVAGDEVIARKPDPEGYLRAAQLLGVDPACCVVLEDSENGAAAGVAAGCVTVVVPSITPVPIGPGRVLRDSLADITVDWLASLARRGLPAA